MEKHIIKQALLEQKEEISGILKGRIIERGAESAPAKSFLDRI